MKINEIKQACIYLSGRKGEKMEKNRTYEVVGISIYDGKSKKDGKPYRVHILEVDFEGKTAKIRTFTDEPVTIGDHVEIGIGTRKTLYGSELIPEVKRVVKKGE